MWVSSDVVENEMVENENVEFTQVEVYKLLYSKFFSHYTSPVYLIIKNKCKVAVLGI